MNEGEEEGLLRYQEVISFNWRQRKFDKAQTPTHESAVWLGYFLEEIYPRFVKVYCQMRP